MPCELPQRAAAASRWGCAHLASRSNAFVAVCAAEGSVHANECDSVRSVLLGAGETVRSVLLGAQGAVRSHSQKTLRVPSEKHANGNAKHGVQHLAQQAAQAAQEKDWKRSLRLIRKIHELGAQPDADLCTTVLRACADAGGAAISSAIGMLRDLQRSGATVELPVYGALIEACTTPTHLPYAFLLFKEMEKAGMQPDLQIYSRMLRVYELDRRWNEARALLREARSRGLVPTVDMYNTVISLFAGMQFWEEIPVLWRDMRASGCQPDSVTYSSAIRAYAQAGQKELALSLLEESWQSGHVSTQPMVCVAVAECCEEVCDWAAALQLLAKMQSRGLTPHDFAYAAVQRALREDGMEDLAKTLDRPPPARTGRHPSLEARGVSSTDATLRHPRGGRFIDL